MSAASPKTVVIVDDEKSYVDLMSLLLGDNLGCPVVTFTRPLAALKALPGLDVGVIVTDYYMPELNGLEFIALAREIVPEVPFILITGHSIGMDDNELAHVTGLRKVLHKPLGWRRLADEIVRHWPAGTPPPRYHPATPAPDPATLI